MATAPDILSVGFSIFLLQRFNTMSLREYFNGTQSNMSNDSPGAFLPQIKHEVETLTLTPNSLDFPVFWHAGLIYGKI